MINLRIMTLGAILVFPVENRMRPTTLARRDETVTGSSVLRLFLRRVSYYIVPVVYVCTAPKPIKSQGLDATWN